MSTENQQSVQPPQKKQKGTRRFWRAFRRPLVYVIILAVALHLTVIHYLLSGFIPPIRHDGVELYESGKYLKYEKGAEFEEYMNALPFAEDTEILSFTYYNFCLRDNVFKGKFSDVYLVQLMPVAPYDSIKQYLDTNYHEKAISVVEGNTIYYLGAENEVECFCVSVNDQRQEIFCLMITDCSAFLMVEGFLLRNLGWVPGL